MNMTTEEHLRAALRRSRRAHKATIAQAKIWHSHATFMQKRAGPLHQQLGYLEMQNEELKHWKWNEELKFSRAACFNFGLVAGSWIALALVEIFR